MSYLFDKLYEGNIYIFYILSNYHKRGYIFLKKLIIFGIISVSMLSLAACGDTSSSKNNSEIKVSNDKPYELAKDLMTNKRMYFSIRNDNSMIGKDSIVDDVFVIDHGSITDYSFLDINGNGDDTDNNVTLKEFKGLSDKQIEEKVYNKLKDTYFSDKRIQELKDSLESFINKPYKQSKNLVNPNDIKLAREKHENDVTLAKKELELMKPINSENISKYIGYKGKLSITGETDSSGNNLQTELVNSTLKNETPDRFLKLWEPEPERVYDNLTDETFESELNLTIPTPIHGMTATVYNDKYYSLGTNDSDILVTKLSNKDNIPMEDQLDSKYIKVKD